MDKTAIKNFAVWARRKLIEDIEQKAFEIGITEGTIEETVTISSDSAKVKGITLDKNQIMQRRSLVLKIEEKGYREVIEEVTYTWFNRFIALRFMEVNDYLPSGVRVLSSIEKGKVEPDIIKQFEYMDLGLSQEDLETLHTMQDSNDIDNLYRFLLVKQCNKLNEILPGLFEEIEDYTEILLPNNLLSDGSVIRRLVNDIPEEDYKDQVEIIGWMYQYYISEKKDEVFEGLKKNIKITKENIPAATQLFTPDWIVKYMVENSLGRLWLEGHPNDELKSGWKYYLNEAEQEPDVQKQLDEIREQSKKIKPEDIKVLDPAMGSGHILVYAFDVLYEIYKSAGYSEKDIPKLILEKNLYGLEIDDRSAQLAYFAVMMKARSKSRRIFREKINLNICSIQESNGFPEEAIDYFSDKTTYVYASDASLRRGIRNHLLTLKEDNDDEKDISNEKPELQIKYLIDVFHDAKEYGSILDVKPIDFEEIKKRLEEIKTGETLNIFELQQRNIILEKIPPLVKQARIMSQKYDVVCTNPPYMGRKGMNNKLSSYLDKFYPNSKNDLFAVFIDYCKKNSKKYTSMITQHSWMFLSSFDKLREDILNKNQIVNMSHIGTRGFEEVNGEVVQTTAFVLSNYNNKQYKGIYKRLVNFKDKEDNYLNNKNIEYIFKMGDFFDIPDNAIAYWISQKLIDIFKNSPKLIEYMKPVAGISSGDNNKLIRLWHEVEFENIGFDYHNREEALVSNKKWFIHNKGGEFRKWYGNLDNIFNYTYESIKYMEGLAGFRHDNKNFYFKTGLNWAKMSSGRMSVRYTDFGCMFDSAGTSGFPIDYIFYIQGLLNSTVAVEVFSILNPTLSIVPGNVADFPLVFKDEETCNLVEKIVKNNIDISKEDWDSFETSWDFRIHPLLKLLDKGEEHRLSSVFNIWETETEEAFEQLKSNEEELNRIFIEIYGLQDELTPEVNDKDVTIRKADRVRDIKSFISYAVGCMFGRYSLDEEGLIFAGGEFEDEWRIENGKWKIKKSIKDNKGEVIGDNWIDATFAPDADNVIPITDDEYFEDDIVSRFVEFVKITFSEETLEENLDYIAGTLGKKGNETPRQTIRRYFIKDFYKDHVQTYQKRPIYWLFDSGKNDGFKALIYMHRYDEFTVSRVRTDYLHKLQHMYEAEYNRLDIVIDSDASEREKTNARKKKEKLYKQMAECLQYDQVIAHVANQRKKIDLDDGVKVNYAKFQDIEVPQGEGKKTLKMDLLAKI